MEFVLSLIALLIASMGGAGMAFCWLRQDGERVPADLQERRWLSVPGQFRFYRSAWDS